MTSAVNHEGSSVFGNARAKLKVSQLVFSNSVVLSRIYSIFTKKFSNNGLPKWWPCLLIGHEHVHLTVPMQVVLGPANSPIALSQCWVGQWIALLDNLTIKLTLIRTLSCLKVRLIIQDYRSSNLQLKEVLFETLLTALKMNARQIKA